MLRMSTLCLLARVIHSMLGPSSRILLVALQLRLSAPSACNWLASAACQHLSVETYSRPWAQVWPPEVDISTTSTLLLQGMHEAVHMTPHTSNPQDVLATWHALKAHPSQMHAITDHLQQQLTHLQADRQQEMLSLADAKADLVEYLKAAAGTDQSSQVMAHAMRQCMLLTADRAQVTVNSKLASVFSCCIVLTVSFSVAGACLCVIVFCPCNGALLIMFGTFTAIGHLFVRTALIMIHA